MAPIEIFLDLEKFNKTGGPGYIIFQSLAPLVDGGKPKYESSGTLMPAVHTLASLLDYLKVGGWSLLGGRGVQNVCGREVYRMCAVLGVAA